MLYTGSSAVGFPTINIIQYNSVESIVINVIINCMYIVVFQSLMCPVDVLMHSYCGLNALHR